MNRLERIATIERKLDREHKDLNYALDALVDHPDRLIAFANDNNHRYLHEVLSKEKIEIATTLLATWVQKRLEKHLDELQEVQEAFDGTDIAKAMRCAERAGL